MSGNVSQTECAECAAEVGSSPCEHNRAAQPASASAVARFGKALAAAAVVLSASGCLLPPGGQGAPPAPQPGSAPATVTVTQPAEESQSAGSARSKQPTTGSRTKEPEAEDGLACGAEELQVRMDPENHTQASGPQATLRVTNVGGRECQLRGYGGLQFLDFDGKPVTTKINRLQANPPTISIKQSQTAGMDLSWDIYHSPCVEPETLQFTPPGDDKPVSTAWGHKAVCTGGVVNATALRNIWGG